MLSNADIKKLKEVFATKGELKETVENILKGVGELFNATNERIDKLNSDLSFRIDKILIKLEEHDDGLNNHERRIEKLEEKIYSA